MIVFGAETPHRTPLCQKLNTLSKISIFSVYFSPKKEKVEIFRQIWLKVTMFLLTSFVARNVEISMFLATKLVNLRNMKILLAFA